ncbi:MAG: tail fiber protein [Actinomycetes bacterium]
MDPFVAEIRIFGFNFPPRGWAFCNGQILPISQNTALFSLLGTTYGGDGRSNFALPNLQGCAPLMVGQGPGLSLRDLGETGGSATVTLIDAEMPSHSHAANAAAAAGGQFSPQNNSWAPVTDRTNHYRSGAPNAAMSPGALAVAGGGVPHNNLQPYLTLNFCIALQGVYPPRT